MIAWILSGGSIKGAFQAGAVKALVEKKLFPDYLYGISVGSLNTTFINHECGCQGCAKENIDWTTVSRNLTKFWTDNIRKPEDLLKTKGYARLVVDTLRGRFAGMVDMDPLHDLIRKTISRDILIVSDVLQHVGAVNFKTGEIEYITPQDPDFIDYMIASTCIPISMGAMMIKGVPYFDGGVRDIAPLKPAIRSGADTIVAVLCQPASLPSTSYSHTNIIQLLERITDIMTHEIEENDISTLLDINDRVAMGEVSGNKRHINLVVIRPDGPLEVDITSFTRDDIGEMIDMGYREAMKTIN